MKPSRWEQQRKGQRRKMYVKKKDKKENERKSRVKVAKTAAGVGRYVALVDTLLLKLNTMPVDWAPLANSGHCT